MIDEFGGWSFCQDLSETVRFAKASAVQIAEFWKAGKDWAVRPSAFNGAGFDLVWRDGEREAVRGCILQAAAGRDAAVNLDRVRDALRTPGGLDAWRAVQMLENHDGLLVDHAMQDQRHPGLPRPRTGKIHGPGTDAAARGLQPACFSPGRACRCCSWDRSSLRIRCGETRPRAAPSASGGTA